MDKTTIRELGKDRIHSTGIVVANETYWEEEFLTIDKTYWEHRFPTILSILEFLENKTPNFSSSIELLVLQCRGALKSSSYYIFSSIRKWINRLLRYLFTHTMLTKEKPHNAKTKFFGENTFQFARQVMFSFKTHSLISKVTIS